MENKILKALIQKGVTIPNPDTIFISDDVDPDRISAENVTLFAGTKIIGNRSLILKNSTIGYEAPVCLENTLVGENTQLNGGFFQDTVFMGDNTFGSGAHVRQGTILEEQANAAHTVGLKQTILFPFVTLGSLINFCDCFMAGGTSRKNHSEIGSSFIHFNYTPNQDKATPSMMGDVPKGVMLQSKPIFLGGQGGIVGPIRIEYGCMSAAGSIIRKNQLNEDRLILGGAFKDMSLPRQFDVYNNVAHIFNNNISYIASLIALKSWYKNIRPLFASNTLSHFLIQGLQENLLLCIQERIKRFAVFCEKLKISQAKKSKLSKTDEDALRKTDLAQKIFEKYSCEEKINETGIKFIGIIEEKIKLSDQKYISLIQNLKSSEQNLGQQWLLDIQQIIVNKLFI